MSKPPSQLQSVEQAWEFGQAPPRELETDSLLFNKSAQRSQWQRTTAVILLAILILMSLAVLAMTLHLTFEISRVSQQLPGGALTSSTAQQMGVFPLLVRHNSSHAFKRGQIRQQPAAALRNPLHCADRRQQDTLQHEWHHCRRREVMQLL